MSSKQIKVYPGEVKIAPKRIRTWSAKQIGERQFRELELGSEMEKLIGKPSYNFCTIIHGRAKSGKSTFSLKLANALVPYGKVLYVASEELISKSLKERIALCGITSDKIRFVALRDVSKIEGLIKRMHARFIIIDSAQICGLSFKDFARLKNDSFRNMKSFHIVLQSTSNGMYKGGSEWLHETDVKITVEQGIATAQGRFRPEGRLTVFNAPATTPDLFNSNIHSNGKEQTA